MKAVFLDRELLSDYEHMLDPKKKIIRFAKTPAVSNDDKTAGHIAGRPLHDILLYPGFCITLPLFQRAPVIPPVSALPPLSTPFDLHRPFYRGAVWQCTLD